MILVVSDLQDLFKSALTSCVGSNRSTALETEPFRTVLFELDAANRFQGLGLQKRSNSEQSANALNDRNKTVVYNQH